MFPSYSRYPFGPVGFNNGKIEHIHHLTMQPFRIPFTYRNKRSDGTMSTFIKNNAIEHTVYNITDSPCQN